MACYACVLRVYYDPRRILRYPRTIKVNAPRVPRLLIQVINLASRPDRLARMESQLKKVGLDFETQVAVDGKKAVFDSKFLSMGEIGAFKSHVNAMRRQSETGAEYSLILEDDAALNMVVNDKFLTKMMELMDRNKIDILQIGFIVHFYSFSLRSGVLESIINLLNGRGKKDPSGFRYVLGEFRSGAHAYIVSSHLAEGISSVVSEPPLLPWDDWLGLMAKAQTHRNFRIARLVKSVVSQASRSSPNSKLDSDIEGLA
jgi:GR25 family glycosyltransferase involved in LPS biosynthesis